MKNKCTKSRKFLMLFLLVMTFVFSGISTQTVSAAAPRLNYKSVTLIKGESKKLKVKYASGRKKWSSSRKSVVTVSSSGVIKARKRGTAVISCKVGKRILKCRVKVETPSLSARSLTLKAGSSKTLVMKNTTLRKRWYSSNRSVATVSSRGKITAKKAGTVTITCKVSSKKYTCRVRVTGGGSAETPTTPTPTQVPAPVLNKTSLSMFVGEGSTLEVSNYSDYCFWSSSDKTVVEVKGNSTTTANTTATLTAHKEGTATITCEAGKTTLTCTVTVTKKIDVMQDAVVAKTGAHNETYMGADNTPVTVPVDEYTITFTTIPDNLEELKQFKLDSKYKTMALNIMLMRTWTPDSQTEYTKMMNYLTHTTPSFTAYGTPGEQRTKSALAYPMTTGGKPLYQYLANSYMTGASVANDYTPSALSVTVYDNATGPIAATSTTPEYHQVWIKCSGDDLPRFNKIYQNSDGNWYVYSNGWTDLIKKIKAPASESSF